MTTSGEHNSNNSRGLMLVDDAEPFRDPPRKCHYHIKEKLQEELEAYWQVLQPGNDSQEGRIPTGLPLHSSLNQMLTEQELNPTFANAKSSKKFSKLDIKVESWSNTTAGNIWLLGQVIQARLDQILEGLWGVVRTVHDVWARGKDLSRNGLQ